MCGCSDCLPFVGPIRGATGDPGPTGPQGNNGVNGISIINSTLTPVTSSLTNQWNSLASYLMNQTIYTLDDDGDTYRMTAFISTANSGSTIRKIRANLEYQTVNYGPLGGANAEFVLANNKIHKIECIVTRVTSNTTSVLSCSLQISYNGVLQDKVEWELLNLPFVAIAPFELQIEGFHGANAGDSVTLRNSLIEYLLAI